MSRTPLLLALGLGGLAAASAALTVNEEQPARAADKAAKPSDTGFVSIFDGKTLNGWHVSAQTGHSQKSNHKSGGNWRIEDGAIVGSQDVPGNGGMVITDKQYGDFEVALDMKNDYGPDSGLFLRSNEKGQCYQAMIDYHSGGTLMGVYGEGIGGQPDVRNFDFKETPEKIVKHDAPFALPVSPEQWPNFWHHGEWNELRARIVGNPPHITTWIKGTKFMDYTDTKKRLPDKGGIAVQVHGGSYGGPGDLTKLCVRYRNIRVKVLDGRKD